MYTRINDKWNGSNHKEPTMTKTQRRYETKSLNDLRAIERRLRAAMFNTRTANYQQVLGWWLDCRAAIRSAEGLA